MTTEPIDIDGAASNLKELNASLPRKVRLFSDDARRLFWCVVIFLGGGSVWFSTYLYHAFSQTRQWEQVQSDGREVTGEIRERIRSTHSTFVRYEFSVDSRVYQNTIEVPTGRQIDSGVGDKVLVRFLPTDPNVNFPSTWGWPMWPDLIPNLFLLLFPVLGVVGAVFLFKEWHLARSGLVVDGRVTSCEPNGRKFRVYYEFSTEDKTTSEGIENYCDDEYDVGSRIRIIYLRNKPSRNDCYPMNSYRTV